MSFLSALGKDIKAVFSWIGSPKGQAVIATGEGLAVAFGAPAAAINLANSWLTEIIKTEALAAAAGQQDGSSAQKAAAAISTMTPEVLAFASQNGLPTPTATTIQNANNALVAFLNAFGATDETTTTAATAPAATANNAWAPAVPKT